MWMRSSTDEQAGENSCLPSEWRLWSHRGRAVDGGLHCVIPIAAGEAKFILFTDRIWKYACLAYLTMRRRSWNDRELEGRICCRRT